MKKFIFFTVNPFIQEGGGTIRMLGIINELARAGYQVHFISNISILEKKDLFHKNVEHHLLNYEFSKTKKRIFQGLLGVLPLFLINLIFLKFYNHSKIALQKFAQEDELFFFEYLDNSIGYWLKKNNFIKGYTNDLHGVATLEFKFQARSAQSIKEKLLFQVKYTVSNWLDKKVFTNAKRLIFASKAMQDYLINQYPILSKKQNFILPYVLSSGACDDEVDEKLKQNIIDTYSIKPHQKVLFFAGAFKKTGGVPDLIEAYAKIIKKHQDIRLLIVGDGPNKPECIEKINKHNLKEKVNFIGRIPYHQLRTYQDVASIIVCPDRQNMYSELIVHVKYLDALVSGKIVINGSFKSVFEINQNDCLSLSFIPSNIDSLVQVIENAIENYDFFVEKYKNNSSFVCETLTYSNHVSVLAN